MGLNPTVILAEHLLNSDKVEMMKILSDEPFTVAVSMAILSLGREFFNHKFN